MELLVPSLPSMLGMLAVVVLVLAIVGLLVWGFLQLRRRTGTGAAVAWYAGLLVVVSALWWVFGDQLLYTVLG